MRRLRWAGWVLIVAMTVVASGCGGGTGTISASISAGGIARAAATTGELESARVLMTVSADGQEVQIDGTMAMDGSALHTHFSVPGGGEIEQRLVEGVMYMRVPGAEDEFGTEWVSVDLSGLLPEQAEEARSSGGADPIAGLDGLAGADGVVETIGEDELRAGAATHYRVRVDAETALARMRDGGVEPDAQQIEALQAMDGEPVDVWVGGDRLLKMAFRMHLPQGSARGSIEFYDFGVPLVVEIPAPTDVTDITDEVRHQTTA